MPTSGLIVIAFRLPLNRVSVWGLQSEKRHLGGLAGPSLRDCSSLSGVSLTVYLFIHSQSGALDQGRPRFLLSFQWLESTPCSSEEGAGRRGGLQSPLMLSTSSNLTYFSFLLLCFVSGKHYFLWQFLAVDKCPVILIRRRSWRLLAQCSNSVA